MSEPVTLTVYQAGQPVKTQYVTVAEAARAALHAWDIHNGYPWLIEQGNTVIWEEAGNYDISFLNLHELARE